MLGALVAVVKLAALAHVIPGISLFAYTALMFALAGLTSITPTEQVLAVGRRPQAMTRVIMGRQMGLLVCTHCHETMRAAPADHARCPRCGARIHVRKPHSVATTAALTLSAAALYLPANLLPVMHTRTFFSDDSDTIMERRHFVDSRRLLAAGVAGVRRQHRGAPPETAGHELAPLVCRATVQGPCPATEPVVPSGGVHRSMVHARRLRHRPARGPGADTLPGDGACRGRRPRILRGGSIDHAGGHRASTNASSGTMQPMVDSRPTADDLPEAVPDKPHRSRLPLVWILPALVAVVGAFVVIQQKLAQGPNIDISFRRRRSRGEQDQDPLQGRGNRRRQRDPCRPGSQVRDRVGPAAPRCQRLSGRRHALLGGEAARDRRRRVGTRHAGIRFLYQRRRGPLEGRTYLVRRTGDPADRDRGPAGQRVRVAHRGHRLAQRGCHGFLPAHDGGPGGGLCPGPGRCERDHQSLRQQAV